MSYNLICSLQLLLITDFFPAIDSDGYSLNDLEIKKFLSISTPRLNELPNVLMNENV